MHLTAVLAAAAAFAGPVPAAPPHGVLAFSGGCRGCPAVGEGSAVYTIRPDGKALRLLVPNASDPRWSPSGRELVFDRPATGGPFPLSELWRSRADGSALEQLTSEHADEEADWSPDGRRLVFVRGDPDAAPVARSMLWTIRRDGSGARLLLRARMGGALDPEWSRDGRRVVFAASADRIYEVASTGDGLRLLAVRGHHPRRSPDGKSLAFVASTKNGVAIKIVNRKTARIRTLASNRTAIALASLAWSPDGRWIAYSRSRQEQDPIGGFFDVTDLWCVRVRDGRRHLIRANVNVDGLDWRRN